jgi:hypothetical protein
MPAVGSGRVVRETVDVSRHPVVAVTMTRYVAAPVTVSVGFGADGSLKPVAGDHS